MIFQSAPNFSIALCLTGSTHLLYNALLIAHLIRRRRDDWQTWFLCRRRSNTIVNDLPKCTEFFPSLYVLQPAHFYYATYYYLLIQYGGDGMTGGHGFLSGDIPIQLEMMFQSALIFAVSLRLAAGRPPVNAASIL